MLLRVRVAIGAMVAVIVSGCTPSPRGQAVDFGKAIADGLCLAQFIGGEIEVVPLNGPPRRHRVGKPFSIMASWGRLSPDGTYIAAVRRADGTGPTALIGLSLDGRELWRVEDEVSDQPAISPDGKTVAFSARTLGLYYTTTGTVRMLDAAGWRPSWAPDGKRIAYDDANMADPYADWFENANVYVYDLTQNSTSRVGPGIRPSWTPDGQHLAVSPRFDHVDLVHVETAKHREFMTRPSVSVPRWSADGRWMTYSYAGGVSWWSLNRAVDPRQIMVRDTQTGAEARVGGFAKANPGDYTWVANTTVCSGK